jgi:histone deacetylase 1/2
VAMADRPAKHNDQHGQHGHTQSFSADPHWYMDTGATDHLTNELGNLDTREPYHGSDKVHTANGSGMHISHIGQASLIASHAARTLKLRNVLRVPSVTRNLLSVPKLTYDNNVLCEFHLFDLFVKDRDTRDVLLSGRLCQGLYRLESPTVSRVFSGVRVSSSQWHARLGHPATPIVHHVLRRHELPSMPSNKDVVGV